MHLQNSVLDSQVRNLSALDQSSWKNLKEKSKLLHPFFLFANAHPVDRTLSSYFVAEKSDGVRCLALLSVDEEKRPKVYLVWYRLILDLVDTMDWLWAIVWSQEQLSCGG